jgi:hypothetical protein
MKRLAVRNAAVLLPVPRDKEYVGRRADEEVRKEGVISIRASPHEQLAAGSSRADSASTSPSTARPTIESTG